MPYCMSHNQCLKSWTNWAAKFCLIRRIHLISCQPTTTSSVSRQFFAGKTLPQPPGCWKCFSRCFVESQSMDIYIIGIKLISHWQKLLIVIIPTLINKDVFEPSYNDLKFMVRNCNYVCTNLKEQDSLQKQIAPFSWNVGYAWEIIGDRTVGSYHFMKCQLYCWGQFTFSLTILNCKFYQNNFL